MLWQWLYTGPAFIKPYQLDPRIRNQLKLIHYSDVIVGTMASQITSLTIVYPTVYSGADQRKHQSSALLAFVQGIHRWPVNSPHKWPITWKMYSFDYVTMFLSTMLSIQLQNSMWCGRVCPSHTHAVPELCNWMRLKTADLFLVDPWSVD